MIELTIRLGVILRGTYAPMKEFLDTGVPAKARLLLEDEPYDKIKSTTSLQLFALLLEDPRLVFDDVFIARQLYFSTGPSREYVLKHPKFRTCVQGRVRFMDYFYERYGPEAMWTQVGMLQRYLHAERAIRGQTTHTNQRLAFHLYPLLIRYIRRFKQHYYAPGGVGYCSAKQRFDSYAN